MREVLVNAFPKSGVTWLTHLVTDLLEGTHQDNEKMEPQTYGHPVTSDWVIRKTHYPYWEHAIPHVMGKPMVFTQRDPRDVIVSAMHYRKAMDIDKAIEVMHFSRYAEYIRSWMRPREPLKVTPFVGTTYEALHFNPHDDLMRIVYELTGIIPPPSRIDLALDRQSFDKMVVQMGGDRHFMRKGVVGDWRNYFNRATAKKFDAEFGEFMLEMGYIDDRRWWREVAL